MICGRELYLSDFDKNVMPKFHEFFFILFPLSAPSWSASDFFMNKQYKAPPALILYNFSK
jgi:hypothetical protein